MPDEKIKQNSVFYFHLAIKQCNSRTLIGGLNFCLDIVRDENILASSFSKTIIGLEFLDLMVVVVTLNHGIYSAFDHLWEFI